MRREGFGFAVNPRQEYSISTIRKKPEAGPRLACVDVPGEYTQALLSQKGFDRPWGATGSMSQAAGIVPKQGYLAPSRGLISCGIYDGLKEMVS